MVFEGGWAVASSGRLPTKPRKVRAHPIAAFHRGELPDEWGKARGGVRVVIGFDDCLSQATSSTCAPLAPRGLDVRWPRIIMDTKRASCGLALSDEGNDWMTAELRAIEDLNIRWRMMRRRVIAIHALNASLHFRWKPRLAQLKTTLSLPKR